MEKRRVTPAIAKISWGPFTLSAWANQASISLGQVKTEEKSNKITAIPVLLDMFEIKGCIITIDAMGCQIDIAEKIIEKQADYVLAVKDNQKFLHEAITDYFEVAIAANNPELCQLQQQKVSAWLKVNESSMAKSVLIASITSVH